MNQHTANDIKGTENKAPHIRERTARWMNGHLQDATDAANGAYADCPDVAQHYIDCYLEFLQLFHKDGEAGSLLAQ